MKKSKSFSFKNATINTDKMTITEVTKDDTFEYDIMKVLSSWNEVQGISLTIKKDDEVHGDD